MNVHVHLTFQPAHDRESAIGTSKSFLVAILHVAKIFLRRLAATYKLHCNIRYSVTSRLTEQQYDITTHPTAAAVMWTGLFLFCVEVTEYVK